MVVVEMHHTYQVFIEKKMVTFMKTKKCQLAIGKCANTAINIVNINNDELGKQSLRSPRNPSLNAQKSRVKLPPMSPRCQKSYQQQQVSQSRNKAARPILHDNIKHSPSLIHPQSQKDNNKYAARPRISATASARKPKTRK